MDQNGGNIALWDSIVLMSENPQTTLANNANSVKNLMAWEEESPANFTCKWCLKTFYNATALQNHQNTQHDGDVSDSEGEEAIPAPKIIQNTNVVGGFKFIPLKSSALDPVTTENGLTKRTFSRDTSYLLVMVDGGDGDVTKRLRSDARKAEMKPKPPVDLRGPFTCTFPSTLRPNMLCRQIFFNCCDYSLHYREEHTKRRKAALRCQVCEKRLDGDVYPENHIAAQFQALNLTFSCRQCGKTFSNSNEYDEHNRIVHAKLKPHQCSICAKRFTQQGGLQQHMRMHTGIRPFICTFCPKAFTQKAGLEQHLRTHTKVKPFKCVICSKCFSQSVHLRQHMRTHTNIQPFECTVCGRRFKQSSHLNFHMRSHVDEVVGTFGQEPSNDQMEFLNLANLQQIQDGETFYYAAELTARPAVLQNPYSYRVSLPENMSLL